MCGICGILQLDPTGPQPDPALLTRMIGTLGHRGPDARGQDLGRQVALGHTRLAILDREGGQQPKATPDGRFRLVFNGEIFNYLELNAELAAAGHRFTTRSDTETVLHAFAQWGPAALDRFNGQFAFALWDGHLRRLYLVRDRVGILPLVYAQVGSRLLFASEARALLRDPAVPRALDPEGLAQTFTFWSPVAPRTALTGIRQVRPGAWLLAEPGRPLRETTWWSPRFPVGRPAPLPSERQEQELTEELRDRLADATRLRLLRSDVPVGVYVSGGLDSSLIAALVRRFHQGPLATFALRFGQPDLDEGRYQAELVRQLQSHHRELTIHSASLAARLPAVIRATETPILRTAPVPLYELSGLVRDAGYRVVLTGEGADEFFAGYDLFREERVRRFWAQDPNSKLRPRLLGRLYPWLARSPAALHQLGARFFGQGLDRVHEPHFSHLPRWTATATLWRLFSSDLRQQLQGYDPVAELVAGLPAEAATWSPLARAQYLEITTLLSGYLLCSQGDRMLMGHSVEGRFPFLDHRVMEFGNALPSGAKLRLLEEKALLRRLGRDLVPDAIRTRPKQPYRGPDARCFFEDGAPEYVARLLSPTAVEAAGLFDPTAVAALVTKCRRAHCDRPLSNTDDMALVGVLTTQLLHEWLREG